MGAFPDIKAARRRIERDSKLAHQPLSAVTDQQSAGASDPLARRLWQAHQARERRRIGNLQLRAPAPGLPARDPWALRALVLLLLVVGLAAGYNDPGARIAAAFTLRLATPPPRAAATTEAWITPPTYVGSGVIYLSGPAANSRERNRPAANSRDLNGPVANSRDLNGPVANSRELNESASGRDIPRIPAGSDILLRHIGDPSSPAPAYEIGAARGDLAALSGGSFEARIAAPVADRIVLRRKDVALADWPLRIIADAPPVAALDGDPVADSQGFLRVGYRAQDDFGLTRLLIRVNILDPLTRALGETAPLDRTVSVGSPVPDTPVRGTVDLSFATHSWADLAASVQIIAEDGAGHRRAGDPVHLRLPVKDFRHPVARRLVALRRTLQPDPATRHAAAQTLDALSREPAGYDGDLTTFLGLRVARQRLLSHDDAVNTASARRLIWDLALRLETGDLAQVARNLEAAMDRLAEALASDADQAEIEKRLREVQQAVGDYMRQLAQMAADGQGLSVPPADAQVLNSQDFNRMFDTLRELSRLGSRASAQNLLNALRSMVMNMNSRLSVMRMMQGQLDQAGASLDQLRDLIDRQRRLQERAFERGRDQSERNQSLPPSVADLADIGEQDDIRRGLEDLMEMLGALTGEIPNTLGTADQAMRAATKALGQGDAAGAAGQQGRALDALRQGFGDMGAALSRALGNPMYLGGQQFGPGPGQDPLGRGPVSPQGRTSDGHIGIPDTAEIQKARRIFDELRSRAGATDRPPVERDYIKRLLDLF